MEHEPSRPDRREFLRVMTSAGALLCLAGPEALAAPPRRPAAPAAPAVPALDCRYGTFSVRHLPELRDWLAELDRRHALSSNATFRKYIAGFRFAPPKEMPEARSVILVSTRDRICSVRFHVNGAPRDVLIPSGYVMQGFSGGDIEDRVRHDVLGGRRGQLRQRLRLPLKTVAVRSGLAEYGRNNITFVEGFGSFHGLQGFWTDRELPDHWRPLRMMRQCRGCSICARACPTGAFSSRHFTIDAGRCLALYNELDDPFPAWLPARAHHTLIGCLRCQYTCPANRDHIRPVESLGEFTEEETRFLVSGRRDAKREKVITDRLPRYPVGYPHLARGARLALANGPVL